MFEDNFRKVEPYTPGEQTNDPSVVKINTNECPYPPSPEVEKANIERVKAKVNEID